MKLSLSKLCIPNVDPVTFIDVAHSAGFVNVGLNLFDVYRHSVAQQTDFFEQAHAIALKARSQDVGMLHCGHCILGDMQEDELRAVLLAAKQCHARYCVGIAHPQASAARIEADFEVLVKHASDLGLQVCVEYSAYSGLRNIHQALELVRQ